MLKQKLTQILPFLWATSTFQKIQSAFQKLPNWQKIAQSGHPSEHVKVITFCKIHYSILSSIMCIQLKWALEFYNDFWKKNLFYFSRIILHELIICIFIDHKNHLKPLLCYLPCIVSREYVSIIFKVKKCTLYSLKYGILDMFLIIIFTFIWTKLKKRVHSQNYLFLHFNQQKQCDSIVTMAKLNRVMAVSSRCQFVDHLTQSFVSLINTAV